MLFRIRPHGVNIFKSTVPQDINETYSGWSGVFSRLLHDNQDMELELGEGWCVYVDKEPNV